MIVAAVGTVVDTAAVVVAVAAMTMDTAVDVAAEVDTIGTKHSPLFFSLLTALLVFAQREIWNNVRRDRFLAVGGSEQ